MSILDVTKRRLLINKFKQVSKDYFLPGGFKRIYFYHIRKAGGTSLNHSFFSLVNTDSSEVYKTMCRRSQHYFLQKDRVYIGWDVSLIEKGYFFYAFSHTPCHKIKLPPKTFRVTILRDPIDRAISYYKMFLAYKQSRKKFHPGHEEAMKWLGSRPADFFSNIPKEYLMTQLYVFSRNYDINEAYENIEKCEHYFFLDDYEKGVEELSQKIGLEIKPLHIRKSTIKTDIKESDHALLRERLKSEIELYQELKKNKKTKFK